MQVRALPLVLMVLLPAPAVAEWQVKPFLGITRGGSTTFVDFEQAAGTVNPMIGVSGLLLGDVMGFEADFGYGPGFFQTAGQNLVQRSSVTTLTGNVVVAMPRRLSEYTLRPYFVGGVGAMRVQIDDRGTLPAVSRVAAVDVGGGVTGFLSDRVGLNWDVRRFWSVGGKDQRRGFSFGPEQLSFWRASMALAIRY
jgi:hypothetical protein